MSHCSNCGQQLDEMDYQFQNCLNCSRPIQMVESDDYEEAVYFEPSDNNDLPAGGEDYDCAAAQGFPIDYPI